MNEEPTQDGVDMVAFDDGLLVARLKFRGVSFVTAVPEFVKKLGKEEFQRYVKTETGPTLFKLAEEHFKRHPDKKALNEEPQRRRIVRPGNGRLHSV